MCNDDVPIERVAQNSECRTMLVPARSSRLQSLSQPPMPNLDLAWERDTMDVESGGSPWDFYLLLSIGRRV